jgi:predicted metal-binding protein
MQLGLFDFNNYFDKGSEQIVQKDFVYQTKKIKFNMHYKHNLISVERLNDFLVYDKTEGCKHIKQCNNFGRCYSCPPFSLSLEKYNDKGYKNCLIYCFWVDWDFVIASTNSYFMLINANRTLSPYATNYGNKLESILGGKDMVDGRCGLCIKCNASLDPKQPCVFPTKRRSSLEAVGLDASKIAKAILGHEIYWYKRVGEKVVTPKYLSCIHGLLTDSLEPMEMVK